MWQRLLSRLERPAPEDGAARRRLAAAVLLLECARADYEHHEAEIGVVREALAAQFGIGGVELDALLAEAGEQARKAVSLHEYVQRLNAGFDADAKRELIAMLWRVAYADGRIDPHEEHLLRRLADLLHVAHKDFIAAKLAAGDPAAHG